jgi:quercetin dioxygenase-like cupin family protein
MPMPVVEVDVLKTLDEVLKELKSGHTARTLVKHGSLRILLLALKAGATVPEHQTEGRVSIHALRGHVRVHAGGTAFDLPAGRLLTLDPGERHDVAGIEDSAVLVTIAMAPPAER